MSVATVWTIGHSTRSLAEFIAALQSFDIEVLADVRRYPGSRKYPHFGAPLLPGALAAAGLAYLPFPELGGRRQARPDSPNTNWRNEAFRGYADYMETSEFRAGAERLLGECEQRRTAIMCAEAVWWRCHRGLVADYLKVRGIEVLHIMGAGKAVPHPFSAAARVVAGQLSYAGD